jgi:ubiquinone/menaquinone biosynthesis C-methylase UbiE
MDLWDLEAGVYDGLRRIPGIRRILEQEKRNLRSLLESVPKFPDILVDIGTGAGSTLDAFPKSAKRIGLDASFAMVRHSRKRLAAVVVGDARQLPFKKRSIRFLSVVGVTEYFSEHHEFLKEVEIVLSPGGYFLVTVSPKKFLNWLRIGLGHSLHMVRPEKWERRMDRFPMVCLGRRRSLFQIQYLYQKAKGKVIY